MKSVIGNRTELEERQWHVRWFDWSVEVLDAFSPVDYEFYTPRTHEARYGTNICHYVRYIALGGFVVPLLHLLVAMIWVWALAVYPVRAFGWYPLLTTIGPWLFWCGLAALAVVAVVFAWRLIKAAGNRASASVDRAIMHWVAERAKRPPGFFSLIWKRIVAWHNDFCFKITIKRGGI